MVRRTDSSEENVEENGDRRHFLTTISRSGRRLILQLVLVLNRRDDRTEISSVPVFTDVKVRWRWTLKTYLRFSRDFVNIDRVRPRAFDLDLLDRAWFPAANLEVMRHHARARLEIAL